MKTRAGRLVTRRLWLATAVSAPLGWSLAVTSLLIRRESPATLRVSAPQIRFLNGKALEQLKNGANVGFALQISMLPSDTAANPLARPLYDRFVVSYDIWEERFTATRLGPPPAFRSRMNMPETESWCLNEPLPIPPSLPADRLFWIKLDLRAEDAKESAAIVGEPGINLNRLVELFSRPPRNPQHWSQIAGPLKLQDL